MEWMSAEKFSAIGMQINMTFNTELEVKHERTEEGERKKERSKNLEQNRINIDALGG